MAALANLAPSSRRPIISPLDFGLGLVLALAACTPKEVPITVAPDALAPAPDPEQEELAARLAWLEAQLEQARVDTNVPGMAIAIVRGDEIIYAKGFGVSDLEAKTPVTPETTFAIGSSTKAFSSALVAIMVDEDKMNWDDPVTKFLPDFQLKIDKDKEAQVVTIRDLLSHRTGFARMSLLWGGGKLSRDEIFAYASKAEPVAGFRDDFHYNNVTYLAGSVSAARAAGTTWEELVQTRLLEPLGMSHTNFSHQSAQDDPNMSKGYTWRTDLDKFELEPMRKIDVIGPAGSINSTVLDMAKWLRLQLATGEFEGKQIVSKNSLMVTRRSVIQIAPEVADYGMGWMLREWEEKKVVEHGGNIDGFSASVAMLPEEDIGVVLLTNSSMTTLQQTGYSMVFEALLSDAYKKDPNPAGEDFSRFAGKYVPKIPGFEGELFEVMTKGGKLAVDVPGQMIFSLDPPDDDGWRYFEATDQVAVSFVENDKDEVTTLVMHQDDLSFEFLREGLERAPEVTAKEVANFLGYYESDEGVNADVVVRDGRLAFDIHKQMAFDLGAPEPDGEYHFRASYDMFVVFDYQKNKKGKSTDKIVGLTFFQDGKTTKFDRKKSKKKVTAEQLHKKRRTDKRQQAIENAGIVRIDQKIEVLSAGIVGEGHIWFDPSGELRQEMSYGEVGTSLVVLHDQKGWSESVFEPLQALEGVALQQMALGHPMVTLGDWRRHYSDETVLRTDKGENTDVWIVKLRAQGLPPLTMHIEAKTGDILELHGFELAPSGMRVPVTTKFSDYRRVEGMRIPFRYEVSNPQSGTVVATVTKIETKIAQDPARFVSMPEG